MWCVYVNWLKNDRAALAGRAIPRKFVVGDDLEGLLWDASTLSVKIFAADYATQTWEAFFGDAFFALVAVIRH